MNRHFTWTINVPNRNYKPETKAINQDHTEVKQAKILSSDPSSTMRFQISCCYEECKEIQPVWKNKVVMFCEVWYLHTLVPSNFT